VERGAPGNDRGAKSTQPRLRTDAGDGDQWPRARRSARVSRLRAASFRVAPAKYFCNTCREIRPLPPRTMSWMRLAPASASLDRRGPSAYRRMLVSTNAGTVMKFVSRPASTTRITRAFFPEKIQLSEDVLRRQTGGDSLEIVADHLIDRCSSLIRDLASTREDFVVDRKLHVHNLSPPRDLRQASHTFRVLRRQGAGAEAP
jgi:hypothetical protein